MSDFNLKNFAKTKVTTGYDASATSITVEDGTKLPTAPFYATWWNTTDYTVPDDDPYKEIIYVGTKVGNVLSDIGRGRESTTASIKNVSGKSYYLDAGVTAEMLEQIRDLVSFGAADPTTDPDDTTRVHFYVNTTDTSLWVWNPVSLAWVEKVA